MHNVFKTANLCPSECPLQQPKAPIGSELSVANDEEGNGDAVIEANHHSPGKVLHHVPILVLSTAVICVQMQICFPHAVVLKEVMQHTNDAVCSLSGVHCLINKVVHLNKMKLKT